MSIILKKNLLLISVICAFDLFSVNNAIADLIPPPLEYTVCSTSNTFCAHLSPEKGTTFFKAEKLVTIPGRHWFPFISNDGKFFVTLESNPISELDKKAIRVRVWKEGIFLRSFSVGDIPIDYNWEIFEVGLLFWSVKEGFDAKNNKFIIDFSEFKDKKPYKIIMDLETGEVQETLRSFGKYSTPIPKAKHDILAILPKYKTIVSEELTYCANVSPETGTAILKMKPIWSMKEWHRGADISNDGKYFVTSISSLAPDNDRNRIAIRVWKNGEFFRAFTIGQILMDFDFSKTVSHYHWGSGAGFIMHSNKEFEVHRDRWEGPPLRRRVNPNPVILNLETGKVYKK